MSFLQAAPEPTTPLGRLRVLSTTAGVRVSPLQLGGMSIGNAWSSFMGSMDKAQAFSLLDAFVAAGGNFIDTSNNYQDEQSERWIGEWMAARGNRDNIVLATKYSTAYRDYEVGGKKAYVNYSGNSRRALHMSLRDSLAKLQTDWVDVLYVHWWDQVTSVEEVMDSLHVLVQQGKVLYLGISNAPAWVVAAANCYARASGKTPFSIYQGRWNVLRRDLEREILPMARHFGMAIAPWDSIGGGKFQSKRQLEARQKAGESLRSIGPVAQSEDEVRVSEALEKVAAEHGVESVTTIALAYVMSKAPYVFPVVGGRKIEHLQDNIRALDIRLTQAQIDYLESVKPLSAGYPADYIGPDPKVTGKAGGVLATTGPMAFVQYPNAIGKL
ncbi:putative aryl-alcohol dehydrogenase Aad14 [Aspergillus puulaauensis]|uniref:Aldo-keto reductase ausK n=1 Tax=Aspergillus puulaauensis TaxID=1220207 RepID=A0A7R7XMR9_9EURO|nr:putative aryl-alcohol dehydrogenase Aad14 [Aspergillus puulaauensis]BCS24397.1 putative aryl-alcohol dehydrogenase Aad14 [Aspergillus puulaauensis]